MIFLITKSLVILVGSLVSVAFMTLMERKVLSLIGLRLGPNKVSFIGLLQPIADAVKLSNKQINVLSNFSFLFYYTSASIMFIASMVIWFCFFYEPAPVSIKYSVLLLFMILGLNSLNSVFCGWSTFSKFALIGTLRTVAQLVSYEASLYLCILFIILMFFGLNFYFLFFFPVNFFFILVPFVFMIWTPSFLAELNRTPYDFSESESELVSGFNTEFGSSSFTLIFLAEYSNIIFLCLLSSFIFFYTENIICMYFLIHIFFVIWIRAVLPRYRFDLLMLLCWKFFVPFLTCYFLLFLIFCI